MSLIWLWTPCIMNFIWICGCFQFLPSSIILLVHCRIRCWKMRTSCWPSSWLVSLTPCRITFHLFNLYFKRLSSLTLIWNAMFKFNTILDFFPLICMLRIISLENCLGLSMFKLCVPPTVFRGQINPQFHKKHSYWLGIY